MKRKGRGRRSHCLRRVAHGVAYWRMAGMPGPSAMPAVAGQDIDGSGDHLDMPYHGSEEALSATAADSRTGIGG